MSNRMLALTLVALALPTRLAAHEGHGLAFTLDGLLHWFFQPTHMAGTMAAVGLSATIAWGVFRARRSGPTRTES